jgi:hypothetical protein
MKKIIITEEEKKYIKRLHNISELDTTKALEYLDSITDTNNNGVDTTDNTDDNYSSSKDYGSLGDFETVTKIVIDKFEGGYWNPFCPHPKQNMGTSTETLFGIDRYNGNIEATPEGKQFFKIIDKEKYENGAQSNGSGKNMQWTNMNQFCNKWKWLYRGGDKEQILKDLAVRLMKTYFDNNISNFVKNPKLKEKIENIPALTLHMSYATWNGPGFFQKFAKSLEDGLNQGMSDSGLINKAIDDRRHTQPLLHQEKVIAAMKEVMV